MYQLALIETATHVKVYRNLTSGKISLLDTASGLVVGHADIVNLIPHGNQNRVKFTVNKAGHARVIKECKKYVHAFIMGAVTSMEGFTPYKGRTLEVQTDTQSIDDTICDLDTQVSYNPYKGDSFINKTSGLAIHDAKRVIVNSAGHMVAQA